MSVESKIYPLDAMKTVGPLIKRGADCSVQVEVISGTGAVGIYQLQSSNSGRTYVNEGAALSLSGITEFTVKKQYVQVVVTSGVAATSGTAVKVSVYADAPGE